MMRSSDGVLVSASSEASSGPAATVLDESQLLAVLLARIDTGIRVESPDGRLLRWNAAYERLFPELAGSLRAGAPAPQEGACPGDHRRPDGRWYRCELHGLSGGNRLGLWSDVTAGHETEAARRTAVLSSLLEGMDQGVIMVDGDLNVLATNRRLLDLYGVPPDRLPIRRFEEFVRCSAERGDYGPGDIATIVATELDNARRADVPVQEHTRPGRGVVEVRTQPLPDGGFVRTYTDITHRKRAEEDLAHKTELLRITLENMGQGIALLDPDLHFITYNTKALELLGIPELMAQNFPTLEDITRFQLISRQLTLPANAPDFGDDIEAKLRYLMERLARPTMEMSYARPQGDGRYIEVRIVPLPDGKQVRTYTDITDRLLADEAVRQSREILKGVIDAIPALIDVKDRDRRVQLVNRYYSETFSVGEGNAGDDPAGCPTGDHGAELDRQVIGSGQGIPFFEESRDTANGGRRDWLTTKMPLAGEDGRVSHIVTVALDITDRKRAEEALARKSALLQAVLDSIGQGLSAFDGGMRLIAWNRRVQEMLDFPAELTVEGTPFEAFVRINAERGDYGPGDIDELVANRIAFVRGSLPHRIERTLRNGTVVEIHGMPMEGGGFVSTYTDMTERKRAEEELRTAKERAENALAELRTTQESLIQAEKMASLAQLVAGVAHEVNTPIGVSLTAISHLGEEVKRIRALFDAGRVRKSDFQEFLDIAWESTRMIMTNIDRAVGLIQSFKQVAVDQASAERRAFDLAGYVEEVLLSLRPRLRRTRVTVTTDVPPDLLIDSYPGAFAQVLSNLIINALIHGFGEERAGHIALTAREVEPGWIELRHCDDGKGIPADILPHIFDPFFTTKRGAGASGLGLNICYNIMTGTLKGSIAVDSVVGQGTSFTLRFPRRA